MTLHICFASFAEELAMMSDAAGLELETIAGMHTTLAVSCRISRRIQ